MTEPSKAAIAKACELLGWNTKAYAAGTFSPPSEKAVRILSIFIEKVSLAVQLERAMADQGLGRSDALSDLILPDPERGPYEEAIDALETVCGFELSENGKQKFSSELMRRGLKIVEWDA